MAFTIRKYAILHPKVWNFGGENGILTLMSHGVMWLYTVLRVTSPYMLGSSNHFT
ncbi:MAG: hypothetical protein II949_06515 [Prevotella sp.]|nr:hypothetical protein [Prevotella sp.]